MERERWLWLYRLLMEVSARCRDHGVTYPDRVIVAVFLWAAIWDRPVSWATRHEHWPARLRRFNLPSQSCMSRRLRSRGVTALLDAVADRLRQHDAPPSPIRWIDAKPLPVSRHSRDPDAAFGRGAGGLNKGYKLYAIWPEKHLLPAAWDVRAINADEPTVGRELLQTLNGPGWLLGDSAYDNNRLYHAAGERGHQLLAHRRYRHARGVGHHRHSPYRLRAIALLEQPRYRLLLDRRRGIETCFGNLTGFGGGLTSLPPWTRRLHRVKLWVHAKLLINALRILKVRERQRLEYA